MMSEPRCHTPPSPCTAATPQEERNHYFRERKRIKALNLQYDPVYRAAHELAMVEREFRAAERLDDEELSVLRWKMRSGGVLR